MKVFSINLEKLSDGRYVEWYHIVDGKLNA